MVDLALVQLDERRVGGLGGAPRRDGISIRTAFCESFEKPDQLAEIFKKNDFAPGKAVLVIPRKSVIVRELTVPVGSEEELASMIRFQLSKELPVSIDEVRYAVLETDRNVEKVKLMVFAVPESIISLDEQILQGAGVRVSGAYVSTQGLVELVPLSPETVALEVTGSESTEILVLSAGKILMTSSISVDRMSDGEIAEQINRVLMSYLSRAADRSISKIYLSHPSAEIRSKLLKGIQVETLAIPGAEGKPCPAELYAVAGVSMAIGGKRPILELKRPPSASKKFTLKTSIRVGALIATILVLVFIYLAVLVSDKESSLAAKQLELADKKKSLKVVHALRAEKDLADQWAGARPQWTETLLELSGLIDTKQVYLTNATFDDDRSMTLNGKAKSRESITYLVQKMEESKAIAGVSAPTISETPEKQGFGWDFTIKARVE